MKEVVRMAKKRKLISNISSPDITERGQAGETLGESEELYRSMIELSPDGIVVADMKGMILLCNAAATRISGYSKEEMVGKHFSRIGIIRLRDAPKYLKIFVSTLRGRPREPLELSFYRKDGTAVWVEIRVDSLKLGGKTIIQSTIRDIAERKRMEEEMENSRAQLQALLDGSPDAIRQIDTNMRIIWANKTALNMTPDAVGQTCHKAYVNREEPCEGCPCKKAMDTGQIEMGVMYQPAFKGVQGESYWEDIGVPMRDGDGKIVGVIEITRNVTERKQAEQRIERLNAVLRAIRNVNQLIAREKDRNWLLKGICDNLIEARGYHSAWVAIFGESGELVASAEAGLGRDFSPMVKLLKRGKLTDCAQRALMQSEAVVTEAPSSTCVDCPLAGMYCDRGAMTVRLEYGGKVYGMMSVSIPKALTADEEEQSLFKEVANDVAFALHDIELEEKRKQAEQALIEKSRELEIASQAKSEFLASMSHELRTPLNAVIGFSELMLDGVPGDINDEQRQCLSDILSSGRYLLHLINDVLDLSKVEARKMELELENLNLADVIDDMRQTVKPMLDDNRHKLRVNVEEGLPQVRADKSRLRQIFLNLLSNAVKFTPIGGELGVEVSRKGDWCQVSVVDNGIGIRQEDQERIFEAFTQADTLPDREKEGTGLGLTVTRQLVELGGGKTWVESEYGKGSKFTFTLPLAGKGKPYLEATKDEVGQGLPKAKKSSGGG